MSTRPARRPRISARYSRLFAAIENMIVGFEPREGLEPFRVPSEPKPLDPLIFAFFGEDVDPVEVFNDVPMALLDLIVGCGFDGGPGGSSSASTWMLTLPSRRHVYLQSTDYDGIHVLAATAPLFTTDDTLRFLELLCADNGARFGIGVIGSPPEEFSIGVKAPRERLIDLTYDLFANAEALEELKDEGEWRLAIPQKPRPPQPEWRVKLREEFGPVRGYAAGMGFMKLCEDYRQKHGIPDDPPEPEEEEREYTDREVVELWLQSQNVIKERRRGRKAVVMEKAAPQRRLLDDLREIDGLDPLPDDHPIYRDASYVISFASRPPKPRSEERTGSKKDKGGAA